jgi:predicted N-acyltransferase
MRVSVNGAIGDIPATEWNGLAADENPFLRHEFLAAAEESGSVSAASGWTPRHLTCRQEGRLLAAMPLYEKTHSWGEFVFDWAWAHAYERAGLPYYPKLVSAIPFTPAPGRRVLYAGDAGHPAAAAVLAAAIELARDGGCSSLHVLFPLQEELEQLQSAGLRLRKDCQFHWHNRDYGDFDDFLATFSSAKRKKARRDRRRVAEAGIRFRRLSGRDIEPDLWQTVYGLISTTFMRRGSLPYFNLDFFVRIASTMPDNVLVVLAQRRGRTIAAAVFFDSDTVLYGRYWGSDGQYDALHFETCYYQGIDYCIQTGRQTFEPGTQGEHKISRGFVPVPTWSAHWLAQPAFFSVIGDYLDEERRHVERYMRSVDAHSPYRHDDPQASKEDGG